jgi:tetratricopeptide (TPR) repeat protein
MTNIVLTIPNRPPRRAFALLAVAAAFAFSAHAQQYTPPPPKLDSLPCVPTKKDPCPQPAADPLKPLPAAALLNPFPGEPSAPGPAQPAAANDAAKANPFPGDAPATPDAPKAPPANDAAKANPFPGEAPGTSSSSSSSSSSSTSSSSSSSSASSSSGKPDDPDADPDDADPIPEKPRGGRRLLPKVAQSAEEREAEDLDVAHTYLQMGNFLASYLRAQDAVKSIPDDSAAHFALALAAQKMKKTDEAIAEYNAYLKLEPDGDQAKQARRALAELGQK